MLRRENEKNLSAEQNSAEKNAWFSRAHEYAFGTGRIAPQTRERAQAAFGLNLDTDTRTGSLPGGANFPKAFRLRKRPEFISCYEKGRRCFSRNFVIFIHIPDERPGVRRLGLAVTRKSGNAVWRNRIKRSVREFFRLYREQLPEGANIVIVPRRTLDPGQLTLAQAIHELLPAIRSRRASVGPGADPCVPSPHRPQQ